MNNCVLGLDLSLTSTGWAIDAADERRKWGVIKTARRGASRLDYIDDAITRLVEAEMPDLVVIENYAFGRAYPFCRNCSPGIRNWFPSGAG